MLRNYDPAAMKKWIKPVSGTLIEALVVKLGALETWQAADIQALVQSVVDEHEVGFAKVAQPIRIAVTGGTNSPSIDQTLELLGRELSLERLNRGLSAFNAYIADKNTA